jgi:hypothetical protein
MPMGASTVSYSLTLIFVLYALSFMYIIYFLYYMHMYTNILVVFYAHVY